MVGDEAMQAMRPSGFASSSIAIGAAVVFIAMATTLSFAVEPQDGASRWALRGTIVPGDASPAPLPAAFKGA